MDVQGAEATGAKDDCGDVGAHRAHRTPCAPGQNLWKTKQDPCIKHGEAACHDTTPKVSEVPETWPRVSEFELERDKVRRMMSLGILVRVLDVLDGRKSTHFGKFHTAFMLFVKTVGEQRG